MNPTLIAQYGFVKQTVKMGNKSFPAWTTTLQNGENKIQVVIDSAISIHTRRIHEEMREAKRLIGL